MNTLADFLFDDAALANSSVPSIKRRPNSFVGRISRRQSTISEHRLSRSADPHAKEVISYLEHLVAKRFDALTHEPERLQNEVEHINEQLESLIVQHYPRLIAKKCPAENSSLIGSVFTKLPDALSALDQLESHVNSFSQHSEQASQTRDLGHRLLANSGKIASILSVPHVLAMLIQTGNFDEVIEMSLYFNRFATRYPRLPLVKSLQENVQAVLVKTIDSLSVSLEGAGNLPQFIKVIGHLRKLGSLSEKELEILFLQKRRVFFLDQASSLSQSNPAEQLRAYFELFREVFFDIVSQYMAIFEVSNRSPSSEGLVILSSFAKDMERLLISETRTLSSKITEFASFSQLNRTGLFMGMSLGRVGIDFGLTLSSFLQEAASSLFLKKLQKLSEAFRLKADAQGLQFFTYAESLSESNAGSLSQFKGLVFFRNILFENLTQAQGILWHSSLRRLFEPIKKELDGLKSFLQSRFHSTRDTSNVRGLLEAYDEIFVPSIMNNLKQLYK